MTFLRGGLPRFCALARGEARLAAAAASSYLRLGLIFAAWAAAAIILGSLVGFAAVILPPTGAFGIVAVVGLILLWVLPEFPSISEFFIRRSLLVVVVADLCIPIYYAFTIPGSGLPWVSLRRLLLFVLVLSFAYNYSTTPTIRKRVADALRADWLVGVCVLLFYIWVVLSIFTSIRPSSTLDQAMTIFLEWYVPFFGVLYVIRNENDLKNLVLAILWSALFVSAAGAAEWFVHRDLFLAVMPKFMIDALAENNPTFTSLVMQTSSRFRNGFIDQLHFSLLLYRSLNSKRWFRS